MVTRSAMYIDGFNLYHSIVELGEPFLKWCNLWALSELILPKRSETLVKVVFCTAFYPGDANKRWRHQQLLNALRVVGVDCVMGHYVTESRKCYACGDVGDKQTEKETDINLALSLMMDGVSNVYDKAYLLTADSDQAATARMFKSSFPQKELVTVSPPGRNFSVHISKLAHSRIALNRDHLERTLFPSIVFKDGMDAGRRPREYDPPSGWVAPKDRPV